MQNNIENIGKKNMALDLIVNVVDGKLPENHKCEFCTEVTSKYMTIINSANSRFDGNRAKAFALCSKHLTAIDKLLTSKKDINAIIDIIEQPNIQSFNIR